MRGDGWNDLERGDGQTGWFPGSTLHDVRRAVQRLADAVAQTRQRQSRALGAQRIDRGERALLADSTRLIGDAGSARAGARSAVAAYVGRLRRDGASPQRVLVLMKDLVRTVSPPDLLGTDQRELIEDVVRWSIDAYYAR